MTTNAKYIFDHEPAECFEALTFADLEIGDKFIEFPYPGDNHGHGGFLNGGYLFVKLPDIPRTFFCSEGGTVSFVDNAMRIVDEMVIDCTPELLVLKVI